MLVVAELRGGSIDQLVEQVVLDQIRGEERGAVVLQGRVGAAQAGRVLVVSTLLVGGDQRLLVGHEADEALERAPGRVEATEDPAIVAQ